MIYAIHKRTKEHRIHEGAYWKDDDHEYVQADPDGWVEWRGGECPLPDGAPHEIRVKNSHSDSHWKSRDNSWHIDSCVTHYRPILDTKPEPPAWDGKVGVAIKVRGGIIVSVSIPEGLQDAVITVGRNKIDIS